MVSSERSGAPSGVVAPERPDVGPDAVAVRARGVSRRYGFQWALRGVDFAVPRGSCVALLGANGSGKTTLLKVVATALKPTRGTVEVLGLDVTKSAHLVRPRVGLLSHQTYLYDDLTALENLRFAAAMYGLPGNMDEAVERALRSVGLEDVGHARVRTFSSGMKRRLALARTTLHDPEVVLLDEPYGALDSEAARWVDEFLRGVRARGATAVVATHHVSRVLLLSQQVLWLVEGRLAYVGPPEGSPAGGAGRAGGRGAGMAWEER